MFVFFLFSLLLLRCTLAEIYTAPFVIGDETTVIIYDSTAVAPLAYIKAYQADNVIYLLEVNGSQSIGQEAVCLNDISIPCIAGPRGCDNPNPLLAVEASNCFATDEEAADAAIITLNCVGYTYGTSGCAACGGDSSSCFGPIYVFQPGITLPVESIDQITDAMLLNAQSTGFLTGVGPRGDVIAVTFIDIQLPQLLLNTTNCIDHTTASFLGAFEPDYRSGLETALINDTRIFSKLFQSTEQMITIRRNQTDGTLNIVLGTNDGPSLADIIVQYVSTTTVSENWLQTLPQTMNFKGNTTTCVATFAIKARPSGPNGLTINPYQLLTDLNYYLNQDYPPFYFSMICGWHIGIVDYYGELMYPNLPEGEIGGGAPSWSIPGIITADINVTADATWIDYTIDCQDFYPRQISFRGVLSSDPTVVGYDGALYEPYIAESYLCLSPFIDPVAIRSTGGLTQIRYQQCHQLGGFVYGATLQVCARLIQKQPCKGGWIYFNEYCYYKFDPTTETRYQVAQSLADQSCQAIFNQAYSLDVLLPDIKIWLETNFVIYKRQVPGSPHRVLVSGNRCWAFDFAASPDGDSDNDTPTVVDVSCETAMFPLCRYHHRYYEVPHSEELWDPDSIRIQQQGQVGVPHIGRSLECNCFNGWSGPACAVETCGVQDVFGNDSLTTWFQNCNINGACDDGQPRDCKCDEFHGPDASYTGTEAFNQFPCPCPASSIIEPFSSQTFTLNGAQYPITNIQQAVCGGSNNGQCIVEPELNLGTCVCTNCTNMNPDFGWLSTIKCFDAAGCTGYLPEIMPNDFQLNGDIVERFCNGIGTACNSGERYAEQRLNELFITLFGRQTCRALDGSLLTGCVCPTGWTGLACTCPSPPNQLNPILYRKTISNAPFAVYALLPVVTQVNRVIINSFGCPAITFVLIQNGDGPLIPCTVFPDSLNLTWGCSNVPATRVILESNYDPIQCSVQAFSDWYPPCGNNTNPTAARFPANEFMRGFGFEQRPQTSNFGVYGCTHTECKCNPNYSGRLCAAAVSAFRYDLDLLDVSRVFCGDSTLPKRGQVGTNGICDCFARQGITDSIFAGEACELETVYQPNGTWAMCNGRGFPVPRSMPYGTCAFDLADSAADPLSAPFLGVSSVESNASSLYTITSNMSVVQLSTGKFWGFYVGQTLLLDGLQLLPNQTSVAYCGYAPLPINMTYVCQGSTSIRAPTRLQANITLWTVNFLCDPRVDIGTLACYTTITSTATEQVLVAGKTSFCSPTWASAIDYSYIGWGNLDYSCIHSVSWYVSTQWAEEILPTGTYQDTLPLCVSLTGETLTQTNIAIGVLDCSDPLDRLIEDVAFQLGIIVIKQCAALAAIPTQSGVLGEAYSLFLRGTPGLAPFDILPWPEENYRFIGSLIGDQGCVPVGGGSSIDDLAYDGQTFNAISLTLFDSYVAEVQTNLSSTPGTPIASYYWTRNATQGPFYQGLEGNTYWNIDPPPGVLYTHGGGRPGWVSIMPTSNYTVRDLTLRIPFAGMDSIQIYGPLGELCYMNLGPFTINQTLTISGCATDLMDAEPRWVTLERFATLFGTNHTHVNALALAFYNSLPYYPITAVWWMKDEVVVSSPQFTTSDVAFNGRETGYTDLFAGLKQSIYVDHVWPTNGGQIYAEQCLTRKPGRTLRALNYSSPEDQFYLYALHSTHLTHRQCTITEECKLNARDPNNYKCVFDTDFATGWLGGDSIATPPVLGQEGGCLCTEGYSPHPCVYCTSGYGPATQIDAYNYQLFFNVSTTPDFCSLPVGTTIVTRQTNVCNGRGTLNFSTFSTEPYTLHVFDNNLTRRCETVMLNQQGQGSVQLTLQQAANDYDVYIMRYTGGNTTLDVIYDQLFVNSTVELLISDQEETTMSFLGGSSLECVRWLDSPTHAVTWDGGLKTLLDSSVDFWLAKVIDYRYPTFT